MVTPIMSSLTWGADGKLRSPAQVQQQRRVAEALLNSPQVGKGWAGALASATQGLAGGFLNNQANVYESQGREAASDVFSGIGPGASNDAIAAALADPASAWATEGQSGVAEALLNSNLKQQDPMYQLQLQQAQLELEQMRNPQQANPYMNVGGGYVFNQATGEFMQAPNGAGADLPADVQEYEYYRQQAEAAGEQPMGYLEYQNALKGNGLSVQTNPDGTTTITQGGPGKPMTEGQSKDTVYSTRARGALPTIDSLETELLSLSDQLAGNVPLIGNYMQSESYQTARTAGKEFLAAILRKDTGAAVTDTEEKNYGDVYLPRPGDKPSVIAYKRQARARALAAIEAGMPAQGIIAQEEALRSSGGTAPVPGASPEVIDWTEL